MQEYFRVSPPSIHQMVLTLERAGSEAAADPRSIELLVDPTQLPDLLSSKARSIKITVQSY